MAPRSNRTAELATEHLVAMFRDERQTVRLEAGLLFKNGDRGGSMYVMRSGTLMIRNGSGVYDVGQAQAIRRGGPRRSLG